MSEYISTFITGFGTVVKKSIERDLNKVRIIGMYDGLVYYSYDGDYNNIKKLVYLNNTFFVMQSFCAKNLTFNDMIFQTCKRKHIFLINEGTCRVRFSKKNQFSKVDKNIIKKAEKHISECTKLTFDRVNPKTEIWYIIRSENVGFYCQLIYKRKTTEKSLNKGELRPEFAYLMCEYAEINKNSVVCDPFMGYGSIPKQLSVKYGVKKVFAFDIQNELVERLKNENWTKRKNVVIKRADATNLYDVQNDAVDAIVTDPPWGIYEKIDNIIDFYVKAIKEMIRVVKYNGVIVILSARKEEMERAFLNLNISPINRINTLVNGKKATIYVIKNKRKISLD